MLKVPGWCTINEFKILDSKLICQNMVVYEELCHSTGVLYFKIVCTFPSPAKCILIVHGRRKQIRMQHFILWVWHLV